MNKSENAEHQRLWDKNAEYKTLEQQIQELWKSRGMEVQEIQFQVVTKDLDGDVLEWIIHAKRKQEVKKK